MASARISAPMRGVTGALSRLSITPGSTCPRASVADMTTSAADHMPLTPMEQQTVLATIHRFPSLEPLRFQQYPANHLYLPTRRDLLHRAVVYEGDNTRLGTASTKTRYEVHGSRRKVRRQKGSGKARLGNRQSPMLRGGGVAFGPRPRDFGTDLQKKVYHRAWRTALSYRFRKGELIIVDNAMELESPSTRLLEDMFKHHQKLLGEGRSLLVTSEERPLLEHALAEMDRKEQALTWEEVDVKNLLELSRVIIEREALHNILLTHEEDITHKALQPWHRSLVRASPPKELESIVGWQEFRDLAVQDPAKKDAARATVYEKVAERRYSYAQTLPQGPNRSELTVTSYTLLANAKELHFTRTTGLPFQDYSSLRQEKGDSKAEKRGSKALSIFPRIQALDYQITVKSEHATTLAETSQPKSEEATIEVRELEVEKCEIMHDASLLAAQVFEHLAEAQVLQGQAKAGRKLLARASSERGKVDRAELRTLEAKLELAEQKRVVAGLKCTGERKAQEEVQQLNRLVAAKRTGKRDWKAVEIEAPRVESVVQVKGVGKAI